MASLQELRKRLKSIRSTGQLAGAMRTAATAKYSKLGKARGEFAPYADALRGMLALAGSAGLPRDAAEVSGRDCLVILGGNRGLCGGFNAELARFLEEELKQHADPVLLVCGKKPAAWLRERGIPFEEYPVSDVPRYEEVLPVARRLRALYAGGGAQSVFVVWQSFKNMLTQTPAARRLLPEENAGREAEGESGLLWLPDRASIAGRLAESALDAQMYDLALENALGAQAATLMAMRSACDNAAAAAEDLEITINRRRQAEVTASVIETASGNVQGV